MGQAPPAKPVDIIDIRSVSLHESLRQLIIDGLQAKTTRTLPIRALYGRHGLRLFDQYTRSSTYYPRHEEMHLLKSQADALATAMAEHDAIVDLGSADLEKVIVLLDVLERRRKQITYYALDLDADALQASLSSPTYKHVQCIGLHGTFDDGLAWMHKQQSQHDSLSFCVLLLGITIGNFSRVGAATFLGNILGAAAPSRSTVVLSIDSCKSANKVLGAYTSKGSEAFGLAGLEHANDVVGEQVFCPNDWDYKCEYNDGLGRNEASYVPRGGGEVRLGAPLGHVVVGEGEGIRSSYSHKYSDEERRGLFSDAGVDVIASWGEQKADIAIYQVRARTAGEEEKN